MTEMPEETDWVDDPLYPQHTHEIILPVTKREVMLTLVSLILFMVSLNAVVRWYLIDHTTNRGYWLARQKWALLEAIDEPVNWLVLGDSSANQGIIPDMLPGGGINLATQGGFATFDDLWMLHRYIERFGPPENVLIVHVYDIWKREESGVVLAQLPFSQQVWADYVPHVVLSRQEQVNYWLARYFPLYAENKTLSLMVWGAIFGGAEPAQFELTDDGYMRLPLDAAAPDHVLKMTQEHLEFVRETSLNVSTVNQAAMNELIQLANHYQMNVYLSNSPLYEGLAHDPDFQNYWNEVSTYLTDIAAQSEYIHFIPTVVTFPVEQMENVDHVTDPAAQQFTQQLAAEILRISP